MLGYCKEKSRHPKAWVSSAATTSINIHSSSIVWTPFPSPDRELVTEVLSSSTHKNLPHDTGHSLGKYYSNTSITFELQWFSLSINK